MALTETQRSQIVQALKERQARLSANGITGSGCPICGNRNFNLNPTGLVYLVLQPIPVQRLQIGGASLPSIVLTCDNCGNTQLLNALVLGLDDVLGITRTAQKPDPSIPDRPTE